MNNPSVPPDRPGVQPQAPGSTSMLAFGCARLGSALTPLGRQDSIRLVRTAYDLGLRHFDTASIYGQGDSERLLGMALAADRPRIFLSSKAGQRLTPKQAVLAHLKPLVRWVAARRGGFRRQVAQARAQGVPRCFEADFLERSLHASLKRLRTDHLDLFYLHSPEPQVLQDDALFGRLERLQRGGMFKALGVSCDDLELARLAGLHDSVQVVQYEFDGSAEAEAVAAGLARQGKTMVVRGLAGWRGAPGGDQALVQMLRHVLGLPGLGGVLVGTTSTQHLRQNIDAYQRAIPPQSSA